MAVQIQFRRDTAANWTSANPTLATGELGLETDTLKFKIGDGSSAWSALSYSSLPSTAISNTVVDAKGDLLVGTADNTVGRLAVGTNEHRLVADSAQTAGVKYVADTTNYAVAAKGDLLVATAADTVTNLTVGTNGHVLTADSAETSGVKWAAPSSGGLVRIAGETTYTSASNITLDGCFTSTYTNYLILILNSATSGNAILKFRAGGVTTSANYTYNTTSSTAITMDDQAYGLIRIEVFGPQLAARTFGRAVMWRFSDASPQAMNTYGFSQKDSTQFDGFILSMDASSMTGRYAVYGYAKS